MDYFAGLDISMDETPTSVETAGLGQSGGSGCQSMSATGISLSGLRLVLI